MQYLHLGPRYEHRHLPNAVLAQTMHLLVQPLPALVEELQREIYSNPALEVVEPRRARCPRCGTALVANQCPKCSRPLSADPAEPIVFVSPREDHLAPRPWRGDDAPDPEEVALAQTVDLPTYVARQISPDLHTLQERRIAVHLLSNLDEHGLLSITPAQAAFKLRVPLRAVEQVLERIQQADPVGVASPSPREALLAQAWHLAEEHEVPRLVFAILELPDALALLAEQGTRSLAQVLGASPEEVAQARDFIVQNLNPYPAQAAWGEHRLGTPPPTLAPQPPDVVISFHNNDPNGPLVVEVIAPLNGVLRVNPLFRQAIRQLPEEAREALRDHLHRAELLVKSLHQRENTMLRLMRLLVREQRAFILHGDEHLKPMTRAEMAQRLGVSESTMSRAVAGKLVQLPQGQIIPLARFFDTSLPVRAVLRRLIASERKPQSDAELARRLKALGFSVARRTVAKYRAMEQIPPAHQRRRNQRVSLPLTKGS